MTQIAVFPIQSLFSPKKKKKIEWGKKAILINSKKICLHFPKSPVPTLIFQVSLSIFLKILLRLRLNMPFLTEKHKIYWH